MEINIEERVQRAIEYFKSGYNCAQSVVLSYADITTTDKETLAVISAPFGGGMGRLREVCGTVSGMFMVSSFIYKANIPTDANAKKLSYTAVQHLADKFRQENGSIICRELLGLEVKREEPTPQPRTESYYQKRPCVELVASSARIIGEMINSEIVVK